MDSTDPRWRRLDATVRAALLELQRRLAGRFGPRLQRYVLFGSQARGTARPDSDVDLLVVVDGLTERERRAVYELGADVAIELGVRVSPAAWSAAEFAEMTRLERLLALDIEREGLPL